MPIGTLTGGATFPTVKLPQEPGDTSEPFVCTPNSPYSGSHETIRLPPDLVAQMNGQGSHVDGVGEFAGSSPGESRAGRILGIIGRDGHRQAQIRSGAG